MPSEPKYWSLQPLFAGQTAFCLASGPSLTPEICGKVRGAPTIVVNSSVRLVPWASVLYFTDTCWYEPRRDIVAAFSGIVCTMSAVAKREMPDKIRLLWFVGDPDKPVTKFPAIGSGIVRQGRTSGHTAICLAVALGASRIVLLGYDMRVVNGREHHHDEYPGPRENNRREYASLYVPLFAGMSAAGRAVGAEIVNATPDSAITEFPFVDLDEELVPHGR